MLCVAYALVVAVAILACLPLLKHGAVDGHSIEYNLVWLKNFSAQLSVGDWYPRWLMGMNRGAGSPVFYYYAPLPFYIASFGVFLLPDASLNLQLAAGECLLIALSGIAFFYYARRHVATLAALVAACVYMLLPYHFEIDLWLRQDIGELTVYIIVPLILACTERIFAESQLDKTLDTLGLGVSYAALMLAHLPSAVLFSVCLGVYGAVMLIRHVSLISIRQFAFGIGLGIALAAIYWVPALFTQSYIRSDKLWTPYFDFHRWLYPATSEMSNPFAHRLIFLIGLTTLVFALAWLAAFFHRRHTHAAPLWSALGLMLAAWFLISPLSLWLWEHAPQLWKVQFPWRVTLVVDLATAVAVMYALHALQQRDWRALPSLLAGALVLIYCGYSADIKNTLGPVDNARQVTDQFYAVRNGLDAPEYTTPWSHMSAQEIVATSELDDRLEYNARDGVVHIAEWSPHQIALDVELTRATMLEIRQFYFPNWQIRIKGAHTNTILEPAAHTGLLRVQAPAGNYRLSLAMAPLLQEWIGGAISVLALLVMGGALLWRRLR